MMADGPVAEVVAQARKFLGIDWSMIPTLIRLISVVTTLAGVIGGATGAYYGVVSRLDRQDESMLQMGKSLLEMSESFKALAANSVSEDKLKAFCLQLQIVNKGFVCHFAPTVAAPAPTPVTKPAPHRVHLTPKTAPAAAAPKAGG